MKSVAHTCKILGDLSRLRLLRLLRREELNVSELTGILGLSQSGVSRHLKLLRDAGLVDERREGGWAYFHVQTTGDAMPGRLLDALSSEIESAPDLEGDLARLEQALRIRRERSSAPYSEREGLPIPGRSWRAWARALLSLLPPLDVADLGCGEAGLAIELARGAREVVAVDRSPEVLARAHFRVAQAGATNVRLVEGELEAIPLPAGSFDLALLSQALHHAASPPAAIREAARILRPGGMLLVIDLERHDEEWVREKLGDLWLGFSAARLTEMFEHAGLVAIEHEVVPRARGETFGIHITRGRKPHDATVRPGEPSPT